MHATVHVWRSEENALPRKFLELDLDFSDLVAATFTH